MSYLRNSLLGKKNNNNKMTQRRSSNSSGIRKAKTEHLDQKLYGKGGKINLPNADDCDSGINYNRVRPKSESNGRVSQKVPFYQQTIRRGHLSDVGFTAVAAALLRRSNYPPTQQQQQQQTRVLHRYTEFNDPSPGLDTRKAQAVLHAAGVKNNFRLATSRHATPTPTPTTFDKLPVRQNFWPTWCVRQTHRHLRGKHPGAQRGCGSRVVTIEIRAFNVVNVASSFHLP
uniref:Uncharacterized protein n=1 Tax=Trichogramma kaykai TaxID=54128 RepID=A0ABD2X3M7_9HYME